jgi:hypothetical protein
MKKFQTSCKGEDKLKNVHLETLDLEIITNSSSNIVSLREAQDDERDHRETLQDTTKGEESQKMRETNIVEKR